MKIKVKDLLMLMSKDEFVIIDDETYRKTEYFDYPTTIDDFKEYLDREVIFIEVEVAYGDEYYLRITI